MDKSKPFGLIIPKKTGTVRPKICNAFESDSDDDKNPKQKSSKIPQSKPISIKTEDLADPSIYEYDTIYDDMKAQKAAEVAPKVKKSSRYIDHLLKAADKRKKEYERRVERKVQLEREKEGDKFEDKEMFVSASYKKKLQEREEEEERERRENQLNEMMDVTKQKDLSGFYRHFLKQSVGEEKIPIFGEKFAVKKEPLRESDKEQSSSKADNDTKSTHFAVKKEPLSESDQEQSSSKADNDTKSTHFAQDKDFEDSDDSSSAEESGKETENSYERSQRVQNCLEEEKDISGGESSDKLTKKNTKKRERVKEISDRSNLRNLKKRTKTSSDEENDNLSKLTKMTKHVNSDHDKTRCSGKKLDSIENIAKETEEILNKETESSESDDQSMEKNPNIVQMSSNETEKVNNNNDEPKKRRNIFEKRTVGDLFAEAQARYFQRLAARTAI